MMASDTARHLSPAVTAYLRRATWGLPKLRQQEVWDELEEHLLTRAEQLQLGDLTPTQALAQALHELGSPSRVTLGMAKVLYHAKTHPCRRNTRPRPQRRAVCAGRTGGNAP